MKFSQKIVSLVLAAVLFGSLCAVTAAAAPVSVKPEPAPSVLLAATKEEQQNAKRIIFLINKIAETPLDECKTNAETRDAIKIYVNTVNDILDGGVYDASANGLTAALTRYEPYRTYYLGLRDAELVVSLNATLDKFTTTSSAVEKLAICEYVTRVLDETPNLDKTSPEVAAVVNRVSVLSANVPSETINAQTRRQNATLFISAVNELSAAKSDAAKMNAYSKASKYYFYMDTNAEGVATSIAIYLAFEAKVAAGANVTNTFIALVNDELVPAESQDEIYLALSHCSAYADDVMIAITGAQDALNTYNRAKSAYDETANSVNEEITDVNALVAGMRAANPAAKKTVALLKKSWMLE